LKNSSLLLEAVSYPQESVQTTDRRARDRVEVNPLLPEGEKAAKRVGAFFAPSAMLGVATLDECLSCFASRGYR
jgi:hypothetical protein